MTTASPTDAFLHTIARMIHSHALEHPDTATTAVEALGSLCRALGAGKPCILPATGAARFRFYRVPRGTYPDASWQRPLIAAAARKDPTATIVAVPWRPLGDA